MLPPWPNGAPPRSPRTRTRMQRPRSRRPAPEAADPPAGDAGAGDHDVAVEREQVLAPPRGNGRDDNAGLLEIPAFLRRG